MNIFPHINVANLKIICRFCLRENAANSIFDTKYENFSLFHLCKEKLTLMLSTAEELPQNACKQCIDKIKEYVTFRKTVLEAQNILLSILNETIPKLHNFQVLNDGNDHNEIMEKDKSQPCILSFNDSGEVKKHKEVKFDRNLKRSHSTRILKTQMKNSSESEMQQNFQCDVCGRHYQTKRNLSRHYLVHTGMPHVCKVCGKGFREANILKSHLNIHNGVNPYFCDICVKSYTTNSALRLHKAYHHEGVSSNQREFLKIFILGRKRKRYKYPQKSETHSMTKHEKSSFPCEICGKVYASRTIVNYHVLTHGSEKKFQCNDCGKMFANKSILGQNELLYLLPVLYGIKFSGDHRRIHRLSYRCTFCNKLFAYAASLQTHINSHTGEKPHKCTLCDKRYTNKSHLKEHIRNHTGERPYTCNICGKSFAVKGNLNGHLKTHSKNIEAIKTTIH